MACAPAGRLGGRRGRPAAGARRRTVTFWDSSAVVPLLVEQEASARVSAWIAADESIVVWTLTVVEVASALGRLVREQAISEEIAGQAEARADELGRSAHVVTDIEP